jgi:hypothetical protein
LGLNSWSEYTPEGRGSQIYNFHFIHVVSGARRAFRTASISVRMRCIIDHTVG